MNWLDYRRIYICGNGGSHANAIHICNDFLMVGLKAYTLDAASLTRTANDGSFNAVFSDWLEVVGEPGDLLVALSGSGTSPNIVNAIVTAKAKGMTTLGVFGAYNKAWDSVAGKVVLDHGVLRGESMQSAESEQLVWAHEIMLSLRK